MADGYHYMVDKSGNKPDLIRIGSDLVYRRYEPLEPGQWTESKFLDAMFWGGGSFMDFDDITEEEAKKYMEQIDQFFANK